LSAEGATNITAIFVLVGRILGISRNDEVFFSNKIKIMKVVVKIMKLVNHLKNWFFKMSIGSLLV
jgi:hypothetical protein